MSMGLFIQNFFNALTLGSLYGLIAIGYTMVYGILRLINFAHGDIFMLGAYMVFFTTLSFMPTWLAVALILFAIVFIYATAKGLRKGLPWWMWAVIVIGIALGIVFGVIYPMPFKPGWAMGVVFAVALTSVFGIVVDRIAYRPLRDAPRISALISAIGASFLLESLGVVLFTGLPRPVVQPKWLMEPKIFSASWFSSDPQATIRIIPLAIIVPVVTVILVVGLLWILYRTKPGLAMRSISKDIETTRLMGVSVDKIIALTFALGSSLAAASGIMWALRYPQVHPYMGIIPGLKAFVAAVVGGIGSIQGAMIGGLLLGFIEIMLVAFLPELSGYKDAFAFILLIVILLFRPTGLMGEKMEDKI